MNQHVDKFTVCFKFFKNFALLVCMPKDTIHPARDVIVTSYLGLI